MKKLRIGVLGAGNIGGTIAKKLSVAGYSVIVAHSGSPESLPESILTSGAKGVWTDEIADNIDVLIISLPLAVIPQIAKHIAKLSESAIIIDTSNYYPGRDSKIDAIENGEVESRWVEAQLGRPVVKAWNMILAYTLAEKGRPAGHADRLAVAISADSTVARKTAAELVEATGFDACETGSIQESWRQQPGSPAYCTELNLQALPLALATAEKERLSKRRDFVISILTERMNGAAASMTHDYVVRLNNIVYAS